MRADIHTCEVRLIDNTHAASGMVQSRPLASRCRASVRSAGRMTTMCCGHKVGQPSVFRLDVSYWRLQGGGMLATADSQCRGLVRDRHILTCCATSIVNILIPHMQAVVWPHAEQRRLSDKVLGMCIEVQFTTTMNAASRLVCRPACVCVRAGAELASPTRTTVAQACRP